jgi:hypothetical protein
MRPRNFQGSSGYLLNLSKSVNPDFIDYTKQKLELTCFAEDVEQPDFTDGPPTHKAMAVRDYWVKKYNWGSIETKLNNESVPSYLGKHCTDISCQASSIYNDGVHALQPRFH